MKKKRIVRYKAEELADKSGTDWQRVDEMTDDDIDTSDIPELDAEWFKTATIVIPQKKKAISLRVDKDVLEWYKAHSEGVGYQTLMNAVLVAYARAQQEQNTEEFPKQ